MMFGSNFPLIHPQEWIDAAKGVGVRDEVMPGIVKDNAAYRRHPIGRARNHARP